MRVDKKNALMHFCNIVLRSLQVCLGFFSKYKVIQIRTDQQKHLGIILDEKLNFECHIDKVLTKTSKTS